MQINLRVDTHTLDLFVAATPRKFLMAAAQATNDAALAVQQAEFARVRQAFIVRRPDFFFGAGKRVGGAAAKISMWADARPGRLAAEVTGGAAGSKGGPVLLALFERGGIRAPFTPGAKSVAVPLEGRPARPSIRGAVPFAYSWRGMMLTAYRGRRAVYRPSRRRSVERGFGTSGSPRPTFDLDQVQWKGRERTFQLAQSRKLPRGGVLQRVGPGRGDIRLLWKFVAPFALDPRYRFVATAEAAAQRAFSAALERRLVDSLGRDLLRGVA